MSKTRKFFCSPDSISIFLTLLFFLLVLSAAVLPSLPQYGVHVFSLENSPRRLIVYQRLILVIVMLFVGPIKRSLTQVASWYSEKSFRNEKRKIILFCTILIICSLFKTHFLFIHKGQPGWMNKGFESRQRTQSREWGLPERGIRDDLAKGLNLQYAGLIAPPTGATYLDDSILFARYEGTEHIYPVNSGLTYNAWPDILEKYPQTNFLLIQNGLRNASRGTDFLIPRSWKNPFHRSWFPIDYSAYPDANALKGLSTWSIEIKLASGHGELVGARIESEIEREPSDGKIALRKIVQSD